MDSARRSFERSTEQRGITPCWDRQRSDRALRPDLRIRSSRSPHRTPHRPLPHRIAERIEALVFHIQLLAEQPTRPRNGDSASKATTVSTRRYRDSVGREHRSKTPRDGCQLRFPEWIEQICVLVPRSPIDANAEPRGRRNSTRATAATANGSMPRVMPSRSAVATLACDLVAITAIRSDASPGCPRRCNTPARRSSRNRTHEHWRC